MTAVAARCPRNRVVFDGQSLNLLPIGSRWPSLAMARRGEHWNNQSNGSTSWTSLHKRAPQIVYPLAALASNAVLVLGIGGETDLMDESDSGATVYADLVAYSAAAKTAGFDKVLGLTIPPSTAFTSPQNTARLNANTLILADASGAFDAKVDVSVAPLDDASNTTYYSDGLHLTAAGALAVADLVLPVLLALLV